MSDGQGATVVEFADRLWRAEVDRTPIDPITETWPDLTLADAYAIQAYNVRRRVEAGRAIRGCRLGRTSQPRQEILGVTEPDFGVLIDDMFVDDGDQVPVESLLQPRASPPPMRSPRSEESCPRLRSSTAASRTGGCSSPTPSPTTPRRAGSSSVAGSRRPPPSTCAWPGCFCTATVLRWRAGRVRLHWAIRSGASPGWPTGFSRPNDVYEVQFAHLGTVTVGFGGEGAAA